MKIPRIIPRLDIKGPNLVKGVHLEGLRVLGKPEEFAAEYYRQGADELIFQDTVASLYKRNSLLDIVSRTAEQIFIPLTVGGGVRTVADIRDLLKSGADKVSINTAIINNPAFLQEAVKVFGSSTIVAVIEAIRHDDGRYYAYTDNGREFTGIDAIQWAREAEERGAGELLLTSIDREGTGKGFDNELIAGIVGVVDIPVIAHGGASCYSDIDHVLREIGADAVAVASMFHYEYIRSNPEVNHYHDEGNVQFLSSGSTFKSFGKENLKIVKQGLKENGFIVRGV